MLTVLLGILKYLVSKIQIIPVALHKVASLFSVAFRTEARIPSVTHGPSNLMPFPPSLHLLSLPFPKALVNL